MRERVPYQPLGRKSERIRLRPRTIVLSLLMVLGVGIGTYLLMSYLLTPPKLPEISKHARFESYSVEVIIEGAPSNPKKSLTIAELATAHLNLKEPARGYGIAVPALYIGPDGKDHPLTYRPGDLSKINMIAVPTTFNPTRYPEFGLVSVRNESESMKAGVNTIEIHYTVDELPLAAPNGAESLSWSFPSPARDFFVSNLQVAIVLPRYAEAQQIRASAAIWRYPLKKDGSIDLKHRRKVSDDIPWKVEEVFLKGTSYRQLSFLAQGLNPYESLDVKVDW